MSRVTTRPPIAVTFRGKKYIGEYEIAGRTLRVFYQGETKMGTMSGCDVALRSAHSVYRIGESNRKLNCETGSKNCEWLPTRKSRVYHDRHFL
jgi:hypothetical protein